MGSQILFLLNVNEKQSKGMAKMAPFLGVFMGGMGQRFKTGFPEPLPSSVIKTGDTSGKCGEGEIASNGKRRGRNIEIPVTRGRRRTIPVTRTCGH